MQALITSHFQGECKWCDTLLPEGDKSQNSRVGRIIALDGSGFALPYYVYVQRGAWRCSMTCPTYAGRRLLLLCLAVLALGCWYQHDFAALQITVMSCQS